MVKGGVSPRPCGQVLAAAVETSSRKMSRAAGLSGEWLESVPGEPEDACRVLCYGMFSLLLLAGAVYTMYRDYIKRTAQDDGEK